MAIQLDEKLGLPNEILPRNCWAAPIALEQPPSDARERRTYGFAHRHELKSKFQA
jgi:hypothetical protein